MYGEPVDSKVGPFIFPLSISDKLQGKSILFVGDSHIRGLANAFLFEVCEYQGNAFEKLDLKTEGNFLDLDKVYNSTMPHRVEYKEFALLYGDNLKFQKLARQQKSDDDTVDCKEDLHNPKCKLFHPRCTSMQAAYMATQFCHPGNY